MKEHLMHNINTISRCAVLYRDQRLKQWNLTGWQAPYLPLVCGQPGITQDQLALRLRVNPSNVTRQLALLEQNGFITRKRSESDRRTVEVYPTEKAQQVLEPVREVFRQWREELFCGLDASERELLEELMERLARRSEAIL